MSNDDSLPALHRGTHPDEAAYPRSKPFVPAKVAGGDAMSGGVPPMFVRQTPSTSTESVQLRDP